MLGRELLSKGLFWRVGNGFKIKAFADKWISGLTSGRSPQIGPNHSILVKDLIDSTGSWDVEIIRSHFPSFETD